MIFGATSSAANSGAVRPKVAICGICCKTSDDWVSSHRFNEERRLCRNLLKSPT